MFSWTPPTLDVGSPDPEAILSGFPTPTWLKERVEILSAGSDLDKVAAIGTIIRGWTFPTREEKLAALQSGDFGPWNKARDWARGLTFPQAAEIALQGKVLIGELDWLLEKPEPQEEVAERRDTLESIVMVLSHAPGQNGQLAHLSEQWDKHAQSVLVPRPNANPPEWLIRVNEFILYAWWARI